MNTYPQRMSPLTAFFLGAFGLGGVVILAVTAIALFGLNLANTRVSDVIGFAQGTIDALPAVLERLPQSVGDLLNDERRPDYAKHVHVITNLVPDEGSGRLRPVITVRNDGDRIVSLLAVRVAALDSENRPRAEWTEVVATPLAIEDEWRGPLMPGATRHIIGSTTWRWAGSREASGITPVVEVADVRVWKPSEARTTSAITTSAP